jgi:hypothetical protein
VPLVDAGGNVVVTSTADLDGEYGFSDLTSGEYMVIARDYAAVATPLHVGETGLEASTWTL